MFALSEKQFILNLAHQSIEQYFYTGELLNIPEEEIPEKLLAKQSCFVTLTIDNVLRGCMGHTTPIQSLYLDIIENAVGSAFDDPRFPPLSEEEYAQTKVEVSILTVPVELDFSSSEDLLNKLRPQIDGVIIKYGESGATYLPQVWEDLSDKTQFLDSLCEKAGLTVGDWKKQGVKAWVYQVEIIK